MIRDEAVEAARPFVESFMKRRGFTLRGKEADVLIGYVLAAAAPHMQPDLLEEWAVQFSSGCVEEAEDEADARRKLCEIQECIADGIETPALEPMRIVQRYRVASSELTEWKEPVNP